MIDGATIEKAIRCMATLNAGASELMQKTQVNACTDITGFGLLGHACEVIEGTEVSMVIESAATPYFPEAREFAEMGLVPGGSHRNRDFRARMVEVCGQIPAYLMDILFDPQTSGGLLISPSGECL
jgi:selenide,water dikinase